MDDREPVERLSASLEAGLRVSVASLIWTVVAGVAAIAVGVAGGSLVLAAFGAIGLLDGVGSGTLVVHFRHALHHATVSQRHERVALRVITIGMVVVGLSAAADSVYRLIRRVDAESLPLGIALAGLSVVVLAALAARKRRIAKLIPSHALHADAWLSTTGAMLAVVTLVGTGLSAGFGWWWVDPAAAAVVGVGAVTLGIVLAREERG